MPTVTDIREQVRDPRRRSIFLDGSYAFSMSIEALLAHPIAVGDHLTEQECHALGEEAELRRAKECLFRALSCRARTDNELRARLRRKQFAEAVIEQAVADLRRLGFVDDRQFAESWVRSRLASGKAGRKRLQQELRARGVDRQVVEESLAGVTEESEFALALNVAQRRQERLRDEEPEAQRRRLASFLQRRGFAYEMIDRVLSTILPPE